MLASKAIYWGYGLEESRFGKKTLDLVVEKKCIYYYCTIFSIFRAILKNTNVIFVHLSIIPYWKRLDGERNEAEETRVNEHSTQSMIL